MAKNIVDIKCERCEKQLEFKASENFHLDSLTILVQPCSNCQKIDYGNIEDWLNRINIKAIQNRDTTPPIPQPDNS